MVSVNDSYSGDHLKCADLKGKEVSLTIASVSLEKVGDDTKLVAYFNGTDRDLVLNKTNANCISQMYGDETDMWVGKKIILLPSQAEFGGKTVPAIRIKLLTPIEAGVAPVQPPPTEPFPGSVAAGGGDYHDDIPWGPEVR